MDEIPCLEAVITVSVNFADGERTGLYTILVTDYQGKIIFEHVIESVDSIIPAIDYMAEKFHRNTKRFKGVRATYEKSTRTFKYYTLDKKKVATIMAEHPVSSLGEPYFGDAPKEFASEEYEQITVADVSG